MSVFLPQINKAQPTKRDTLERSWIYVPYDRLTDRTGPLHETNPEQCGIVMVESLEKGMRRPYHKKKLVLVLANERHFALEQAARGVKAIYILTKKSFGEGLLQAQEEHALKQITLMRPAERELRLDLKQAQQRGLRLHEVEDSTWLTRETDFDEVFGIKQATRPPNFLIDRFYRAIRKRTGLLMENGKPIGGKFSYATENRKPYRGHVHRATDGYRDLQVPYEKAAKWMYAGATPTALNATLPLPAAYWGVPSGWNCLDTVVRQVVNEGWSHHITRLMVLSNLATLCGFSPRELTDWFWIAYVDAYDWVVEPNVLGMSTYGDGGVTATKPYVSGAAYINRMSDYCKGCKFDPARSTGEGSCPFTALYWSFLERNSDTLSGNQRLLMPYATLHKKSAGERKALRARAAEAMNELASVPRPEYQATGTENR